MSEAQAFRELIRRVRGGDDAAATEMVRRYEATIRLAIRVRLDQSDLRRPQGLPADSSAKQSERAKRQDGEPKRDKDPEDVVPPRFNRSHCRNDAGIADRKRSASGVNQHQASHGRHRPECYDNRDYADKLNVGAV